MTLKKVLLVINCLQGGGAEKSVLTLGQGFYELGYEVHVLRFKPTVEYDLNPHLNYHQVSFKPFKLIPSEKIRYQMFAKTVDKYVKKHIGIPLLTISNLDRADRVLANSKLSNIIHVIRNTLSQEIKQKSKPVILSKIRDIYKHHQCIGISEGVTKDFSQTLQLNNIQTIYNPIDKDSINNFAGVETPSIPPYIIHVGSFKHQKAHDTLIKAYARTSQRYSLVLLGQGSLMSEIQNLVKQLNLESKVIFMGFKSNPYPYIKNAKLMVLSSRFEGFGRVIAEALALNTPVISTDCPSGPREMLPSKNLTEVDNVVQLADILEQAMQCPDEFSVPFNQEFLPKVIAQQYIQLINNK